MRKLMARFGKAGSPSTTVGALLATTWLLLLALAPLAHAASSGLATGWNNDNIAWHDYQTGLAKAKADGKPVLVVVHTTWCPHCTKYQAVFQNAKVVEAAKRFVMVLIDRDIEPKLNEQLGPQGQSYVPRTLVLGKDGKLRSDAVGHHPKYPHLIDNTNPVELLKVMGTALAKS